jgi:hypothetical protein
VKNFPIKALFCIIFLLKFHTSYANDSIRINDSVNEILIPWTRYQIFEDSTGKLDYNQIITPQFQKQFHTPSGDISSLINTHIWIKIILINESVSKQNWLLQLPLHSEYISAFIKKRNGSVEKFKTGQKLSFNSRPIDIRTIIFELPSERNVPIEIYLKFYSEKYTDLAFIASNESRYMEVHTKSYLFLGVIYGILFLMAIYNFMLFLSIKERIYLYYVIYTLCAIFFISWKDGLGFQFLWPNLPVINEFHYHLGLFLLLSTFLLYANNFLELKQRHPRLFLITYGIIFINFIYLLVFLFGQDYFDPLPVTYILSYFYFFLVGLYYIKQKYKPARYLVISLACIISALVVIKLRYLGIISWNWFVEYILNYAVALEAIAMSLAVRDKITYLRIQKEKAQEAKLIEDKLKAENELIQLKNSRLENEVTNKNNELASLATSLNQKAEFLSHLKEKLENMSKNTDQPDQKIFKEVIKTIDEDLDFDDKWTKFQIHFDEIHNNFLHRFREKHPKLNQSWLLFCAYLRMNKSNKEIAALMNISISAVDKRRYRLKEKLQLDSDRKLLDYLLNF